MYTSNEFMAAVYVRQGGMTLRLIHSIGKYGGRGAKKGNIGKLLGFVGDRTSERSPHCFILTEGTALKWENVEFDVDTNGMTSHFGDKTNAETAYSPATTATMATKNFPRMLFVPVMLVGWLRTAPRTPWQLRQKNVNSYN